MDMGPASIIAAGEDGGELHPAIGIGNADAAQVVGLWRIVERISPVATASTLESEFAPEIAGPTYPAHFQDMNTWQAGTATRGDPRSDKR